MGIVESVVSALFETFGVFLFPAAIFAIGVGFYLLLWWLDSFGDGE